MNDAQHEFFVCNYKDTRERQSIRTVKKFYLNKNYEQALKNTEPAFYSTLYPLREAAPSTLQ